MAEVTNTTVLGAVACAALSYATYNLYFHPLAQLPGPLIARLGVGGWRAYHMWRGDYSTALLSLHDKPGGFVAAVRIGRNLVSICDAPTHATAYGAASHSWAKSDFYTAFQATPSPSLFSDIDVHSHNRRRKAVAPLYSVASLLELEDYVDPLCAEFVGTLDASCSGLSSEARWTTVDVGHLFHLFAMDVIGAIAFGGPFDLLAQGDDPEKFLPAVYNLIAFGSILGSIWRPLRAPVRRILPALTGRHESPSCIAARTTQMVASRYRSARGGTDLLTKFMAVKDPISKVVWSQQEVVNTSSSLIAAGSDTTAAALCSVLYFVASQPEVQAKCFAEISLHGLSSPVRYGEGVKLDYVRAVIKESLRLQPPISGSFDRVVPEPGVAVGGCFVPAGVTLGTSPYVWHRAPAAYGADAADFRPERWILESTDVEHRQALERSFFTFATGPRVCIGRNIAIMELTKLVPTLLREYEFKLPDGRSSSPWELRSNYLNVQFDFTCDVRKR